jgi:hypothetical protein
MMTEEPLVMVATDNILGSIYGTVTKCALMSITFMQPSSNIFYFVASLAKERIDYSLNKTELLIIPWKTQNIGNALLSRKETIKF